MSKIEKYLPFIISAVLPGITIFNNLSQQENTEWQLLLIVWLSLSTFLIVLWKVTEKLLNISNLIYKWMTVFCVTLAMILAFTSISHLYLHAYIKLPENGYQSVIGLRFVLVSVLYIAIIQSKKSAKEREQFRVENILLQSENLKAQLNQLRQQVNPHFLFNCLNTLRSMVRINDSQSEEYIMKLSDVYRQMLQKRESTIVLLKEELEFLKAYTYLLKLRHENALTVDIEIKDESLQYNLPTFALQLLVENCIKHNIVSEAHPLHIRIYQPDLATIIISNNYQLKNIPEESFGLGVDNLKTRYELLGIKEGVQIEQSFTEYKTTLKLF